MFKFFVIIFILNFSNLLSQEVKKIYDKYENKFYLSLEDDFDLTVENNTETLDFDMNILKVYNSNDTSYFIKLTIESISNWICSSIESKCIIKLDKEIINLRPTNYDKNKEFMKVNNYNFDLSITKSDLLKLNNAKNITVKYVCIDGEMKGIFNEDEIKELKEFIKKYVAK